MTSAVAVASVVLLLVGVSLVVLDAEKIPIPDLGGWASAAFAGSTGSLSAKYVGLGLFYRAAVTSFIFIATFAIAAAIIGVLIGPVGAA